MQGTELPYALSSHAMINMENKNTMIIGGYTESGRTAQTHTYNHYHKIWSVGPSLIQARYWHAAGIVTDEATMDTYPIVTGGWNINQLKSTEILKGHTWSSGKNFFSIKRRKITKRQECGSFSKTILDFERIGLIKFHF